MNSKSYSSFSLDNPVIRFFEQYYCQENDAQATRYLLIAKESLFAFTAYDLCPKKKNGVRSALHLRRFRQLHKTELMIAACKAGNVELVRAQIERKASLIINDPIEGSPVHVAASYGKAKLLHWLLTNGAPITTFHVTSGLLPLQHAYASGRIERLRAIRWAMCAAIMDPNLLAQGFTLAEITIKEANAAWSRFSGAIDQSVPLRHECGESGPYTLICHHLGIKGLLKSRYVCRQWNNQITAYIAKVFWKRTEEITCPGDRSY